LKRQRKYIFKNIDNKYNKKMTHKKNTYRKRQQNRTGALFGLRRKRIGFCCNFGRHLGHYSLSGTLALRVFLSGEGKGN